MLKPRLVIVVEVPVLQEVSEVDAVLVYYFTLEVLGASGCYTLDPPLSRLIRPVFPAFGNNCLRRNPARKAISVYEPFGK
jgi:hypothetical protein